jgi:localization factor PodJL
LLFRELRLASRGTSNFSGINLGVSMKPGGPWNLRGLRPEARAAARDAARRSGMSVGQWLNTVIRPAEERDTESRRSAPPDRMEGGHEPRRGRKLPQRPAGRDERGYDRDQAQEWERHSARRAPDHPEPRGSSFSEPQESWGRGFGDEDISRRRDSQTSPRRPSEAPKEHSAESFRDEPERDRGQYYERPNLPQERARNEPQRPDAREDHRDRERSRLRTGPSRERERQWIEEAVAVERELPRERYRDPRPDPARQSARDEDWHETSQGHRPDRDDERYREAPRPFSARNEDESRRNDSWRAEPWRAESWQDESWQDEFSDDIRKDNRQREKSRSLPSREPGADRFEGLNLNEGPHYRGRDRDRDLPRLAPEREPEESWQAFSEEETDRYLGEPSRKDDGESEDAERSNFDHQPDRALRRRPSFEPEEPFETIPREGRGPTPGRHASEPDYRFEAERSEAEALNARRAKAGRLRGRQSADQWEERFPNERDEPMPSRSGSRPGAGDSENIGPRRMRFGNREEHSQRRDTRRQRQGGSDDEQWPPEQDTSQDESIGMGGPYRDLSAAARTPASPSRGRRREGIFPAANADDARDAAVDKAIAEITVRQRALDEAAAAEMAARLRRAEVRTAQQEVQNGISAEERFASAQHAGASNVAANRPPPPASAETAAQWTPAPAPRPSADITPNSGAPASHRAEVAPSEPKVEPRPLDRPPQAAVAPPPPPRAENSGAQQKTADDRLVAEITARMRALDNAAAADKKAERQTGVGESISQRSLIDDVAADILAEKIERDSAGEGTFNLEPALPDSSNQRSSPVRDEGRKNWSAPGLDIGDLERQLRHLNARIDALRPTGDLNVTIDGLRRELSDIGRAFTEALPRRALESLELEIKTLGHRLDHGRESGRDSAVLAEIERGLAEVRAGLNGLTPAEELVGFGDAVAVLTQKVDAIVARNDTAAIAQLQDTIGDLRLAVSRVASDDALNTVAEEVRVLSAKVDTFAKDGPAALEQLHTAMVDLRHAVSGVASDDAMSTVADEVRLLSAKVDSLGDIAKGDPGAMEQLHIAISNLRHAVSRVASDDAVSRLGEEVHLLSARMDDLAHNTADNRTLLQIESRIDALTTAIHASTKNGQAVPRELEKLLSALIDKLELSQLTQTDHTALTHLEDRIAMLMQRLDASDARLGLLEGVERGLADLLVYIKQLRAGGMSVDSASGRVVPGDAIDHQFAEIKDSERRTQDSIEAVQGTVEHVVDRLARIESGMRVHRSWSDPEEPSGAQVPELAPSLSPAQEPEAPTEADKAAEIEPAANRRGIARMPIDPDLPPDHPLEPGSAPGRTRRPMTPVERLAALDSAAPAKPPVIPDPAGGKADFIAAARRAAQAAASTSPNDKSSVIPGTAAPSGSKKLSDRLRTLFVAAAVVAIVVGGFRVVSQMLDHGSPPPEAQTAPPRVLTEPTPGSPLPLTPAEPTKQPGTPGRSSDANTTSMSKTVAASGADPEQNLASAPAVRQTLLNPPGNFAINSGTLPDIADGAGKNASGVLSGSDVTGSLPPAPASGNSTAPLADDKLPSAIGGPSLRTAASAGDPAAAYEVGVRFADGRNVPQNNEEAARWLEIAAKKGFVPAQFRLGTFYEKGVGVKKDLLQALSLYRAAADKGHGKAMHNLAVLYAEGASGAPDYRTASQWFRKAAELGVTDSQYNLAILYARGVGVDQSFAEAYKWFFLAAKQGDKDAAQKRDEVASRLDQQALAVAKSAAEQWTAQPQPAEAVAVKASDAWDPPAKGTSALKPKSHSAEKIPAPDVMKVN